jgi:hypothetical protein
VEWCVDFGTTADPIGSLVLFTNLTCCDLQIADLIEFNSLKTRIGNRQRITRYRAPTRNWCLA